jgi:hypothetical protein
VVTSDGAAGSTPDGTGAGAAGGSNSSGGSGKAIHPSPTRPGNDADVPPAADSTSDPQYSPEGTPVPPGFDASGLSGLFGVGAGAQTSEVPAGATGGSAPAELAAPLPGRDHRSSLSSALLLALSLLILGGLAAGAGFYWWDRRPDRYWPA